jgi:hypothetical protein
MSSFLEELEQAVKVRREHDHAPVPTGEEMDVACYHDVVDIIKEFPDWGDHQVAHEAGVGSLSIEPGIDFVQRVRKDVSK